MDNKKKKKHYYESFIVKLLKTIANNGITSNSKQQLNSALCILSRIIANKCLELVINCGRKTISEQQISSIIKLLFTNELFEDANQYGLEAVENFKTEINKHSSRQNKAGIIFPPSQVEKFLRNFDYSNILISKNSAVYFAAILEKICIIILQEACRETVMHNHIRIKIRDLELAIRNNRDINNLFCTCNITFLGGGFVPFVHESLLNKKPRKKKEKNENDEKRKFRPGTVAIREIRRYQKLSNCLTFAKLPFERIVRSKIENQNVQISKDVFIVLQYYIEQFVMNILRDANSLAIYNGRVKLIPSDVKFICKLKNYED